MANISTSTLNKVSLGAEKTSTGLSKFFSLGDLIVIFLDV